MAGRVQFLRHFTAELTVQQYQTLVELMESDSDAVRVGRRGATLYFQATSNAAVSKLDQVLRQLVGFSGYKQQTAIPSQSVPAHLLSKLDKLPIPSGGKMKNK